MCTLYASMWDTNKMFLLKKLVWKAERRELEVNNISTVEEVVESKFWAVEKVTTPAGSTKLVKVRTEGN